jgi:excisionase family DNA binding protein
VNVALELTDEVLDEIADRVAERLAAGFAAPEPSPPFLSIDEAAEYARCGRQRIYDLRSSGRLSRHGDGRRALVSRTELDALLEGSHAVASRLAGPQTNGSRERTGG